MNRVFVACALAGILGTGCAPPLVITPQKGPALSESASFHQDVSTKQELRLVPQEVFLRNYTQLFLAATPLEAQKLARGKEGGQVFDNFADYLSALGFPDYRSDLPRAEKTNALMVATFERLGDALCDRAVQHDLKATPPLPISARMVFAFDLPTTPLDAAAFFERLDVVHQTFLSYPLKLAPLERAEALYRLYRDTVSRHQKPQTQRARFTAEEAAWAAVCYALARHPEYHLY